ncbi:MAG: phosphotransferase [Metamycoplasmataceae bacterium]
MLKILTYNYDQYDQKVFKKKNISNLKLFYDGYHNKTFKGLLFNELVQVRISKNEIANHNNELKLLKNSKDVIYIDKYVMIKKWINGNELDNNSLQFLIKIKDVLTKHWLLKINGITSFKFDDNNYYNDDEIVLSHGDLRRKNIIIDNKMNVHLIDFEWTSYTSKYFDLAHLHLYCFFSISEIVKVFHVDKTKLKIAITSTAIFNSKWEKEYN